MNDTIHLDLGGGSRLEVPARIAFDAVIERLSSTPTRISRPALIGTTLRGQGGIFAGDILGDDGVVYGLVIADEDLQGTYQWSPNEGEIQASSWDGLVNTNALLRLNSSHPAARAAKDYSADGHADFYLPAKREMQIIAANLPHLFQPKPYWTSTPYGSNCAWAVHFEFGSVDTWYRSYEFRVRPVRRFTY